MNKLLLTIAVLSSIVYGQVSADLTIANQQAVPPNFFFDIYLTRTSTNDLYLGNADFVLTFDVGNFTNPVLSKEGTSPGFCTFVPTDASGLNTLFTQDYYFTWTSAIIENGNELRINLNGPAPSDQTAFDTRVAKIDNTPSTHRLGRFRVSGISNPNGFMNLQWKTTGTGVQTRVFTLAPVSPWTSSAVTINAINPQNAALPVELSTFTAKALNDKVQLNWETKTEVNNYGFDVERAIIIDNQNKTWNKIGFVEGNGNSNSPKEYSFVDKNLFGGSDFVYRLKQIDTDGLHEYSAEVEVELLPTKFELYQNYPNPFNPVTSIKFSLPEDAEVMIKVFDVLGSLVDEIVKAEFKAGYHKIEFDASGYASGIYIYRLECKNFISIKKMVLIK